MNLRKLLYFSVSSKFPSLVSSSAWLSNYLTAYVVTSFQHPWDEPCEFRHPSPCFCRFQWSVLHSHLLHLVNAIWYLDIQLREGDLSFYVGWSGKASLIRWHLRKSLRKGRKQVMGISRDGGMRGNRMIKAKAWDRSVLWGVEGAAKRPMLLEWTEQVGCEYKKSGGKAETWEEKKGMERRVQGPAGQSKH